MVQSIFIFCHGYFNFPQRNQWKCTLYQILYLIGVSKRCRRIKLISTFDYVDFNMKLYILKFLNNKQTKMTIVQHLMLIFDILLFLMRPNHLFSLWLFNVRYEFGQQLKIPDPWTKIDYDADYNLSSQQIRNFETEMASWKFRRSITIMIEKPFVYFLSANFTATSNFKCLRNRY